MIKKITLLFLLIGVGLTPALAQTAINFDTNCPLNPGGDACWNTFMNVSNLPAPDGDGAYQFGSNWGIPDLVAIFDAATNTVTLRPNRVNDPDPYWQTGNLNGNKIMDANLFVQSETLRGTNFTFNGSVDANTLNNAGLYAGIDFTVTAFIKVFNADFSSVIDQDIVDLRTTSGDFSLSMDATSYNTDQNIQFGFQFIGPNIGNDSGFDADYTALGSIVVGPNSSLSTIEFNQSTFSVSPNPSSDSWRISASSPIENVQVYDILGKQVLTLAPSSLEVEVPAQELKSGLYLARITGADGSDKTIRLLRQ